jgi:hypothetical protein
LLSCQSVVVPFSLRLTMQWADNGTERRLNGDTKHREPAAADAHSELFVARPRGQIPCFLGWQERGKTVSLRWRRKGGFGGQQ